MKTKTKIRKYSNYKGKNVESHKSDRSWKGDSLLGLGNYWAFVVQAKKTKKIIRISSHIPFT